MKNLLITGSSGFIGSYCVKNFLKEKYNVFCISSKKNKIYNNKNFLKKTYNKNVIKKFLKKNKINYVLLSHGSINHFDKFDNVYKDHFLFTKLIIENLDLKYLKKIIFLSTGDEYGPVKKLPISENYLCKPVSNYALVKNMTTNYLINFFQKYDISIVVLRLFLIYGENQKSPRLIPLLKNNLNNNNIFFAKSLNQKKDFCHISDLYKLLSRIFIFKKNVKDIFNFGSGHIISIRQVIKIIENKFGKKIIIKSDNSYEIKNSFSFYPDISKVKKTFKLKSFKKMSSNLI